MDRLNKVVAGKCDALCEAAFAHLRADLAAERAARIAAEKERDDNLLKSGAIDCTDLGTFPCGGCLLCVKAQRELAGQQVDAERAAREQLQQERDTLLRTMDGALEAARQRAEAAERERDAARLALKATQDACAEANGALDAACRDLLAERAARARLEGEAAAMAATLKRISVELGAEGLADTKEAVAHVAYWRKQASAALATSAGAAMVEELEAARRVCEWAERMCDAAPGEVPSVQVIERDRQWDAMAAAVDAWQAARKGGG